MADDSVRVLVVQGLQAARAGGTVAEQATAEIEADASDAGLKSALQQGNRQAAQWRERVERALHEAGAHEGGDNPILEAHFEVSRRIRAAAPDPRSRDLGIIAAGQLALHYWIAAFGTLRTYAESAQLQQTRDDLQRCVDEAKEADGRHTQLAARLLEAAAV